MPKAMPVCNCDYNVSKQMVKALQVVWNVDQYIKDAKREGHKDCAKMWQKIKADEERHAKMLRDALKGKVKKGEFC